MYFMYSTKRSIKVKITKNVHKKSFYYGLHVEEVEEKLEEIVQPDSEEKSTSGTTEDLDQLCFFF